jgi:ABC-type sulfate/molybdate transport systems ATPase subunit
MNGVSRKERAGRLGELLERTALENLSSRYPSQLSGGEARRVALARAIAANPQRLLLDEPLSNLDPELRAGMLDLIWQVRAETGVTLIVVSHDPLPARADGERVVLMRGGRVVKARPRDEMQSLSASKSASRSETGSSLEMSR